MTAKSQMFLHFGCLLRGNLIRPERAWFHVQGIARAVKEQLQSMKVKLWL